MAVIINPGTEAFVGETMARLGLTLPYSEKYGGLDFSDAPEAVVVNAIVENDGFYLAMYRSALNDSHAGKWNNIAGYMQGRGGDDGRKMIEDTLAAELSEEAGIDIGHATSAAVGRVIEVKLKDRVLHVVPALIRFADRPDITLNHEHDASGWMTRQRFFVLQHVPVVDEVFKEMGVAA